jgi:FtsP/CotA-like multicopper oxidase with cupredoxin domain
MSSDHLRNRPRRAWLALAVAAAPALAAPGSATPAAHGIFAGSPRAVVRLEAIPDSVAILPGRCTAVLRYTAAVESGDPSVLEPIPDTYLGPIFRLNQGDRLRVRFLNHLGEPTIVHWHGLVVPDSMDGHPRFAVGDGGEFVYDFTVLNRAGTYWYHPHPDMTTGPQVVRGLAGLFLTSDSEEAALGLPRDEFDLPIVIQDRAFDASNQIEYWTGGMHGSFLGDRILVNGRLDALDSAATRA